MFRIITGIVLVVLAVVVSCASEQQSMAVMMGVIGTGFLFAGMLDKPEPTE
ncbi:hypothetical protein SEA_BEUFFERT_226 [Streptomyces phage Beuffert]|nr:hypothetical protein SEA_BEUFFERT_226 [Streptomyces phage Beuffert]